MASPRRSARRKKRGGLAETTRFLIILFVAALILRSFILAPFVIPSGSMLPRLMIGDFLFVAKWPYGYSRFAVPFGLFSFDGRVLAAPPARGDVVVFRYPGGDDDYVKRVIGLPGDRISVRDGRIVLNGRPVARVRIADWLMPVTPNSPCRYAEGAPGLDPVAIEGRRYCRFPRYRETLPGGRSFEVIDQHEGPGDEMAERTVPPDHLFVMGDNRDDSADSRFSRAEDGVGFLPQDHLVGRALITFFSTDGSAEWLEPWTWFSAARWDRVGMTF